MKGDLLDHCLDLNVNIKGVVLMECLTGDITQEVEVRVRVMPRNF